MPRALVCSQDFSVRE